jgi:hypothetical protein
MKNRIARLSGVAIRPCVSKNGRRYTTENIGRAYQRLNARLSDPQGRPVVMRTLHPASGSDMDVTNVAARLTSVSLGEDGELRYEADVADTQAGHDVAALTTAENPYLSTVSIRGWWVGTPTEDAEGHETADDLEIDGLDFVTNPGVEGARILAAVAESAGDHQVVIENVESATVTVTEAPKPTPGSNYADPGYQKDGKKRYPLDTAKKVRAAWSYINQADNQKPYTAAQLSRIKGKIKKAAKSFGIDIAQESRHLAAEITEVLEAFASSYLDNGQGDVRVTGYTTDPADLAIVGQRVAAAAQAAMVTLDPDNDGDIDTDSEVAAPSAPICPSCGLGCEIGDLFCSACGTALPVPEAVQPDDDAMETAPGVPDSPEPGSGPTEGDSSMTATPEAPPAEFAGVTTSAPNPHGGTPPAAAAEAAPATPAAPEAAPEAPAAEAAPEAPAPAAERNFTDADLDALAARLRPAAETVTAPAAEAAPTTAPPTDAPVYTAEQAREMAEQAVKEAAGQMKAELTKEAIELVRTGGRKGVTRPTDESGAPKPLHEMSDDERNAYARDAWSAVLARPAV